jgi:hypothetical protein
VQQLICTRHDAFNTDSTPASADDKKEDSGSMILYICIGVGAFVLIGAIVFFTLRARRARQSQNMAEAGEFEEEGEYEEEYEYYEEEEY